MNKTKKFLIATTLSLALAGVCAGPAAAFGDDHGRHHSHGYGQSHHHGHSNFGHKHFGHEHFGHKQHGHKQHGRHHNHRGWFGHR